MKGEEKDRKGIRLRLEKSSHGKAHPATPDMWLRGYPTWQHTTREGSEAYLRELEDEGMEDDPDDTWVEDLQGVKRPPKEDTAAPQHNPLTEGVDD